MQAKREETVGPGPPSMDDAFRALADPSRRRLLDSLDARDGQSLKELCGGLQTTRQSVSKHLAVLEAASLVTTVRRGREKLHFINAAPIHEMADRWIGQYDQGRLDALAVLKRALQDTTMEKPEFVYTTYIRTTPELLWRALTEPEFTERYWKVSFACDWKAGSTYALEQKGLTISDPAQVVLESDPYRRLAYSWHVFTPEWAEAHGFEEEFLATVSSQRRSKVTFDIERLGEVVKLTVVHDDFDADSAALRSASSGWPQVLSNLKTLLETGETMPR